MLMVADPWSRQTLTGDTVAVFRSQTFRTPSQSSDTSLHSYIVSKVCQWRRLLWFSERAVRGKLWANHFIPTCHHTECNVTINGDPERGIGQIMGGSGHEGSHETYGLVGHPAKHSICPSSIHPSLRPPQSCDKSSQYHSISANSSSLCLPYFKHLISPLSVTHTHRACGRDLLKRCLWLRDVLSLRVHPTSTSLWSQRNSDWECSVRLCVEEEGKRGRWEEVEAANWETSPKISFHITAMQLPLHVCT